MTRPRILFVSIPGGVGGSTRSMANVLSALAAHDIERVLAAPARGRFIQLVRELDVADAHLPVISNARPLRPLRRFWSSVRLAAWALRNRGNLSAIHANGLKELSLALPASMLARVRLVVWVHNFMLPPSIRIMGPLWRLMLKRSEVRWAAVSPLARRLVVEAGLARSSDVSIIPNPIDPADLLAVERGTSERVRVAYLGAPRRYKGFHLLPELIERVSSDDVEWLVFSRPTDDDLADTWDRLRELAGIGRVTLAGKLVDVRAAYGRCDVVVCPSLLDSFCRVAAEAMINGIPVVGTDLEPIQALLGDDEAGLVVPVGDVAAMAVAVERLVDDSCLRSRLGSQGRRRAALFAPDEVGRSLRREYGLGTVTETALVDPSPDPVSGDLAMTTTSNCGGDPRGGLDG